MQTEWKLLLKSFLEINVELSQSARRLYDKAPLNPDPCKQESSHAERNRQVVGG